MANASGKLDPRTIITPDAFRVAPELLGRRLATPFRRLVAILLDLIFIGILATVTRSFALLITGLVGLLLVRAGFRRGPARGGLIGRAMRLSVGFLGLVVTLSALAIWVLDDDPGEGVSISVGPEDIPGGAERVLRLLGRRAMADGFRGAATLEDAEEIARGVAAAGREMGIPNDELRASMMFVTPEDAPWAAEAPAMFDRVLAGLDAPESERASLAAAEAIESRDADAVRAGVSLYTDEEALEALAAVLRRDASGAPSPEDEALRRALQERLTGLLAGDTLGRLEERVADLSQDLERAEDELREAEDESGGLISSLRGFMDDLGFGFGWAALYMTLFSTWLQGRTPAKWLLGMRVLRLDGTPITWWIAFERAGGYFAGVATGLLGFAQVIWDPNRQAIHDRIVGTVVVREGADRVTDWERAL